MPDIVTFDPIALIIEEINTGLPETELNVVEMYSEWKAWLLAALTRLGHPQAFSVEGGAPITPTQNQGSFFFLENSWRFRPANYDHQVTLIGNLFVREGGRIDVPTVGGFQVNVRQQFSSEVIEVVGTTVDPVDIATILQRVTELWQRSGLDAANPMFVSESGISVGAINIDITGTTTKTVTRV